MFNSPRDPKARYMQVDNLIAAARGEDREQGRRLHQSVFFSPSPKVGRLVAFQ